MFQLGYAWHANVRLDKCCHIHMLVDSDAVIMVISHGFINVMVQIKLSINLGMSFMCEFVVVRLNIHFNIIQVISGQLHCLIL